MAATRTSTSACLVTRMSSWYAVDRNLYASTSRAVASEVSDAGSSLTSTLESPTPARATSSSSTFVLGPTPIHPFSRATSTQRRAGIAKSHEVPASSTSALTRIVNDSSTEYARRTRSTALGSLLSRRGGRFAAARAALASATETTSHARICEPESETSSTRSVGGTRTSKTSRRVATRLNVSPALRASTPSPISHTRRCATVTIGSSSTTFSLGSSGGASAAASSWADTGAGSLPPRRRELVSSICH
eukprot:Amastigsp_a511886_79.p3 type:complete len:248 gc:universal Amastigsp_a511886_79:1472-729(-)